MTWTRGRVVLLTMLGAGVTLAAGLLPWMTIAITDAAGATTESYTGAEVVPGAAAAGLAALAGAGALSLADGWLRRLVGVIILLCGVALVVLPVDLLLDPEAAQFDSGSAVIMGTAPWVAAVSGLLVVAGGVASLTAGRHWPARAARRATPERTAAPSDWDRLSDGDDPT